MAPRNKNDKDGHEEPDALLMETSALLLRPSPNSTNRPSLTNLVEYGSLIAPGGADDSDVEEPQIQMLLSQHLNDDKTSFGDDEWPNTRHSSKKRRRRDLFHLLLSIAAILLVAFATFSFYGKKSGEGPAPSSNSIHHQHGYISRTLPPLSHKHPVKDLHVKSFQRPEFSGPNPELFLQSRPQAVPTNSWYQNLLLARHEPTQEQRVYPVPYVLDVVGPIPGIRVHHPSVVAGATVIQLTEVLEHGLTLGAASRQRILGSDDKKMSAPTNKYKVAKMTALGITLEWTDQTEKTTSTAPPSLTYSSSIVRGMPYATMQYNSDEQQCSPESDQDDELVLPTVASETPIGAPPVIDGEAELKCGDGQDAQWVQKEIQLIFAEPDYTWLVFVSRPVRVKCIIPPNKEQPAFVPGLPAPSPGIVFALQFLDDNDTTNKSHSDLVIRMALVNDCTYGANPITCGRAKTHARMEGVEAYATLLRENADLYPGPDTDVTFDFVTGTENTTGEMYMNFNWNAQSMGGHDIKKDSVKEEKRDLSAKNEQKEGARLLMFALPHHQDMIDESHGRSSERIDSLDKREEPGFPTLDVDEGEEARFCKTTLLGPTCLVFGSTWNLQEDNSWKISFRAPRSPENHTLPALVKAYKQDLNFELPSYFQRGAGDTYFSGKMLAKLARILTIGEELHEICTGGKDGILPPDECKGVDVPSPEDSEFQDALARLRSSVEVWINGTASTPFVYDSEWGGVVSCGCNFDPDKGICRNQFPDCPAFDDPGLNFGNAFYNDHHFHYGYHIYAAAAVSHFDPQWGRDHFEQVLLLIRDFANPSHDDSFFPLFRNKDWYQGNSWASGTAVSPLNGRNQESSSEAIAAYEGIALFGMEMLKAWKDQNQDNARVAKAVQQYGELLTASEVRSADRYWHVIEASKRRQYPAEYTPHVVGMLWNEMAQFQTWFGSAAFLAYGIQLLPLTSVSEKRDTMEWARELYEPFAESCNAHLEGCREGGWSVLVLAILATVGHADEAIQEALELPNDTFTSAGGNGHSLTNTLWYFATRPAVDDPLLLNQRGSKDHHETAVLEKEMHRQSDNPDNVINGQPPPPPEPRPQIAVDPNFDCHCPDTCNTAALNRFAVGHSCRDRIIWLMTEKDHNEWDACHQVGLEFPGHCAACDPKKCSTEEEVHSEECPPCSKEICNGKLNLCPIHSAPFLCTKGANIGGCSRFPWTLSEANCEGCCELTSGCGK